MLDSEQSLSTLKRLIACEEYNSLLDKYGKSFKHDYGWAANALNMKKPTFKDIEASVKLDHNRPYYKSASANVHGNPSGVLNNLGLLAEEEIILSGPSNLGLSTPAQSTVLSLNVITTMMLAHDASMDAIVISKVFAKYGRQAEEAFLLVEEDISKSINE